jgi:hypothetical protein
VKQQLVYHLLRIIVKTVRPKDDASIILNNYIIKTIMLWECEVFSSIKWKFHTTINICRRLIHKLATCIGSLECRSYFVSCQNLLQNFETADELKHDMNKLMNVTNESLCLWFIDNYIRQCAEQCPPDMSREFHDKKLVRMLPHALSLITEWRRSRSDEISCTDFETACFDLQQLVFRFFPSKESDTSLCKFIIEHLQLIDSRLLGYFYAACFLKASSLIDRDQSVLRIASVVITLIQSGACAFSNDDARLVECMNDGYKKYIPSVSRSSQSFTVCKYFQTASVLLLTIRLSYNKYSSLARLLTEVSKVYLYFALQCTHVECSDFHVASRSLLNVLLTCLYCSTKQRKTSFILNYMTISSLPKHRISFCHVERQLLPCFDTTIETILGLILFYNFLQHVYFPCIHKDIGVMLMCSLLICSPSTWQTCIMTSTACVLA